MNESHVHVEGKKLNKDENTVYDFNCIKVKTKAKL